MKTTIRLTMLLAILLAMFSYAQAVSVQVGDGTATTSYFPYYGLYGYGYTQQVYTQAQVNFAGEITKIRFFYVSGAIANNKDWTIYMGHTQRTEFESTTDWEDLSNLTQVFDGDVTAMLPATNNWMEIILDTPFNYNNIDNLLLAVHQYTPGYASMSWGGFTSGSNTGIYFYSDSVNPEPSAPPTANSRSATINRIQLVFPDTEAPMAPVLVSPENGAQVMSGQTLSWAQPHGSADVSGYDLYIDDAMVSENQPGTTYAISPLETGDHTWYVVAHNNIGSSAPSETRTFEYVNGVIIGTGTASQQDPFNAWFGYGRSLGLYTFAEIGQLGVVTTVGWSVATANTATIPYKIYAKLTDDTALTAMSWDAFTSTATVVKQGSYTFNGTGWHNFLLDTPITYTGGNLLIGVEANYGGGGASGQYPYFHYSTSAAGSHQRWFGDNNPPTTNGTLNTNRPNLLLMLSALSDDPMFILNPPEWDFGRNVIYSPNSKSFSIINAGGGLLNVTSLSPMSDGFFEVTEAPTFPVSLALGESASFTIEYLPTAAGNHSATFTITDGRATTELEVSGECFDPVIYDYPFFDGFEIGQTHGSQVQEWTQFLDDGKTKYWMANSTETSYNRTPRNGSFNATLQYGANAWLMRPFFLEAGQSYDVEVWARQDGAVGSNANVGIHYGAGGTLAAMTNVIKEQTDIINGDYQQIKGSFIPSGDGVYWIAIHGVINSSPWYISIDDITVRHTPATPIFTYTPETIEFGTGFANTATVYQDVTVTNNGGGTLDLTAANISLTGTDAAMFEFDAVNLPLALLPNQSGIIPVRYYPTAEGAHTATLRMVYDGDNYDVALSGNALSEHALFESFEGTQFPPPGWSVYNGGDANTWIRSTTKPRTGAAHAQITYGSTAHDDWLITPKIAPTATKHTISFYGSNNNTYYDERFNVKVSTTDGSIASFTNVLASDVSTGASDYMYHSFDLTDFIGQNIFVAIQAISTNLLNLMIDDVSGPDIVVEAPSTPVLLSPVDEASLVSLTPTLTWAAAPGGIPTGYKVYCDTNNPPTTEIADVATTSYTHTTELLPETVYYWTVKAYNADGTSDAATAFSFTTLPEGMVIIGDGTVDQKLPVTPFYGYSYSQSIYLQPEINTSDQRIEKISYYWNGAGVGTNSSGWTVYMGHTDKTAFDSVSDWISLSALTQVFSGNAAIPSTAGWVEIVLQTPFVYNNVQNLVIAVDENTSGYDGNTQFFYNTNVSTNRSLLYYSDGTNPDPASPPATGGYLITAYPNIMMQLGDLPTSPIFTYSPETIDFGTVMNGETSDPVNVRISNTGSGTINLNASDISIIGPNAAEFAFDPINLPASLSAGQSVNIPVTVTGITEGNISATLRVVYDSENYDVALTAEVLPAGIVFIGDGTLAQRWPFGTLWGFEHSASLYKADEINLNGLLTMVGWDCAVTSATAIPYKIWAKNTTETSLTAQTWTSIAADLTLLKEGTYTFNTPGWHGFTLDTPFEYTGGNLIIVTESAVGGSGGGSGHTFKYTSGVTGGHQYWNSDNTFNQNQAGVINANRPNLMLHIAEPIAGPPAEPILTYPADGAINLPKAGFNLTWSPDLINGGIPDYYAVFLASDEGTIYDEYYWETENTFFNPVTEGGFTFGYEDRWYWTVQAINVDGDAVADPPYSFVIEDDPAISTFPWMEDFEGTSFPPAGWARYNLDGGSQQWESSTSYNHTVGGAKSALHSYGYNDLDENGWLVTPPISLGDGGWKLGFWSYNYYPTYYEYSGVWVTTGNPDPAIGPWTEIWNPASVSTSWAKTELPLSDYANQTIYLAFVYQGYDGHAWYLDDISINGLPLHDLGIRSIDMPEVVAPEPLTPKVTVINSGASTESFDVTIEIGAWSSTMPVSNLASGQTQQLTFDQYTPVLYNIEQVTVSHNLASDLIAENDEMVGMLICLDLDKQAYADRAYNPGTGGDGPSTFNLKTPQSITDLPAANPFGDDFLAGADWINNGWWGAEYYDSVSNGFWWKINTDTGAGTAYNNLGVNFNGVAWDPSTETIYATNGTALYTIDHPGIPTLLGTITWGGEPFDGLFIDLACDIVTGTLYALDIGYDAVFTIDPITLACEPLGYTTGYDHNYAQGMAIDQETGMLYLAAYTSTGMLLWVNTVMPDSEGLMGQAFYVGDFQNGSEMDGFVIPYNMTPEISIDQTGLITWNPIRGAVSYKVYESDDPYSGFTLAATINNLSDPSYQAGLDADKKFYQVRTVFGSSRGRTEIQANASLKKTNRVVRKQGTRRDKSRFSTDRVSPVRK